MRAAIAKRLSSFYIDVPALRPGTIGAYLLAFASVGVATALRLAIDPFVGGLQFATFFPAVIITTLISGLGAGLFSVLLSLGAVAFFVLPPRFSLYIEEPANVLALVLYMVAMLFNVAVITGLRIAVERQRDQQDLQESKDRLQSALDAGKLGSWRYDHHRRVFSWDARFKEIFGVPEDGATVEEFMNWVHPGDEEKVRAAYHRVLDPAQPEQSQTQFRLRRENGNVRRVETQGLVQFEGEGRERHVVGLIGTVRDITARKSAEEAQARLAAIVTSSADAIVGKTLDGIVTNWNEAAERMFGYSADEIIGQSIRRVVPSDRQAEEDMILSRMAQSETIERYEMMLLARDGRTFDASVTISPIRDAEGRNIGYSEIVRDITARKRTLARLAEREAQLALFVEHAPAAIAMFDDQMRYLAVSRRYVSDFRLPPDIELIGRSHYEVFPDVPPRWREVHARVLAGEELAHEEDPFLRLDGRTDWCRWLMKPWHTAHGRIGGALLFTEVITEQLAARHALADSEARFRATFENAAVGIVHFDPDFRWLRVNEAVCRILGYRADELIAKSLEDINDPDDLRACLVQVGRMRDREIESFGMDKRYRRKDGSVVWVRLTNGCVRKSDGSVDYFVCTFEDISARKHTEEELRKSEERFRSSVLHSPLPILLFDDREQILAVSQSWLAETGYSREELCGLGDWTVRAYGDHSGEVLHQMRQMIVTEPEAQPTELMIRTKDGRERLWSFVSSALGTQSDGRRLFVCVAQDVTDRKAHEDQVQLLMREVNHRAKNILSLVQAIARQTAARDPEDFIGHFTERLQALAANQDLLVRSEWRGVDVEDLARAQLAHFADLVGSRIATHGPKLRLKAAAAQTIGLAMHELATNAGKYGALSTGKGRVDVGWGTDGDTFSMSWTEREGPLVSAPKRSGFGTTVVERMAKQSVEGVVELDYAPSGLSWRLTCPAANALEYSRA
jgi:PAS domain S-box-containing protein